MDLFEMANIKVEETKTVKAVQKAKANKQRKAPTAPKNQPKVDTLEGVNLETVIRFSSMNYPLTDYFTEEEITNGILVAVEEVKDQESPSPDDTETSESVNTDKLVKITTENLRSKMERDFPELVKDLTHIAFVKEKNLIVVMNAAGKKGASASISKAPIYWEDGLLFYSNNNNHVRIPESILRQFIAIARGFSDEYKVEVHGDVYYNSEKDSFHLHIPPQTAGSIFVEPDMGSMSLEELVHLSDMQKVLEIHSHHIMRAYPSQTDDQSERLQIYYAIVGRIDQLSPQIYTRTFDRQKEKHIELDPSLVFNTMASDTSNYPQVQVTIEECEGDF